MLCSCSRYPSRDIFFDMDSKSYSTFMNGLTDNTYTCYPVCSQSEDQLLKIMDVFLCCMEEPDALKEDYFFRREALRYELESEDEELSLEGTVFNEDWGHLTDIQENADSFMAETLYEARLLPIYLAVHIFITRIFLLGGSGSGLKNFTVIPTA